MSFDIFDLFVRFPILVIVVGFVIGTYDFTLKWTALLQLIRLCRFSVSTISMDRIEFIYPSIFLKREVFIHLIFHLNFRALGSRGIM